MVLVLKRVFFSSKFTDHVPEINSCVSSNFFRGRILLSLLAERTLSDQSKRSPGEHLLVQELWRKSPVACAGSCNESGNLSVGCGGDRL